MEESGLWHKEGDLFSGASQVNPKIQEIKKESESQGLAREIAEINKILMDNSDDSSREKEEDYAASSQARNWRAQLKLDGVESKQCTQCDYASSHTGTLTRHLKRHNEEQSRKRSKKCNMCSYSCSQSIHLRSHLRTHSGEKSKKCSQCDYATDHTGTFKRHFKAHSGDIKNGKYACVKDFTIVMSGAQENVRRSGTLP